MDLNLKGKTFIVSGGSKGIGRGISKAIHEEGGNVVIATRSEGPVTSDLIAKMNQEKLKAIAIIGDLQDLEFCKNVIDQTIEQFEGIDGIINNAGMNDGAGLQHGPGAFTLTECKKLCRPFPCQGQLSSLCSSISRSTSLPGYRHF